ncbi:protein kinase [Bacteroidales bacterium OttesenSCG-928-A17]|nr:protein kinase [Bacteroidales bacterium OttesenSCG-928-A17]
MNNSSFGDYTDFFLPSDVTPFPTNGATSDTYVVRIFGKWHFLKRPKEELSSHPQYLAAFEKEFDLGYTLDHPNIVRYISKGNDKSGFYFLTEYVEGLTLTEFLKRHPKYFKQKDNRERFIRQLLSAVSYLHGREILHLDLKPDNLLITNVGRNVKIIDLGFAYSDCYQFFTVGRTNAFAAPEQLRNEPLEQGTDIYGIGKLLSFLPRLSFREKACVRKCLNSELKNRYRNVEELTTDLSQKKNSLTAGILLLLLAGVLFWGFHLYKPLKTDEKEELSSVPESTIVNLPENEDKEENDIPFILDTKTEKLIASTVEPISTLTTILPTKPDPISELRDQFLAELQKIYTLHINQAYSLESRYKKWLATQDLLDSYINRASTEEEKTVLSKLLYKEENKRSAPYIQQSVIHELKDILSKPLSEEKTPESVLLAFNKKIAPYYLPFYRKYVLIDDYTTYIRAKNELEEIKKEIEPILHSVFPNNPDVYSSREVFYEKFMARMPNYPYYNYIYPAEDLLRNYLFNYEE